jgi:hypothetical protein
VTYSGFHDSVDGVSILYGLVDDHFISVFRSMELLGLVTAIIGACQYGLYGHSCSYFVLLYISASSFMSSQACAGI